MRATNYERSVGEDEILRNQNAYFAKRTVFAQKGWKLAQFFECTQPRLNQNRIFAKHTTSRLSNFIWSTTIIESGKLISRKLINERARQTYIDFVYF